MGIYAFSAVSQAIASLILGGAFALLTYFASQQLHKVGPFNRLTAFQLPYWVFRARAYYARSYVLFASTKLCTSLSAVS